MTKSEWCMVTLAATALGTAVAAYIKAGKVQKQVSNNYDIDRVDNAIALERLAAIQAKLNVIEDTLEDVVPSVR